ncbi:MAG TPA: hypothetical protein VG738_06020 [Chitinophagaceae bacterium]|nr:hypothetical protein [Chitinophagaceae bacterium]
MKKILCIVIWLTGFAILGSAQNIETRYIDSNGHYVTKEKAYYYIEVTPHDSVYTYITRWLDDNSVYIRASAKDTGLSMPVGPSMGYYKSGRVKDSMMYDRPGSLAWDYHFKEDGMPDFYEWYDKRSDSWLGQKYDNTGKLLPQKSVYMEAAKFPGGVQGWIDYLTKHLRAKTVAKHKAPPGLYTVIVTFLVDKEGKISEVTAANDPGYGAAEEAVRVIKEGPDWIPAQQFGRKVIYRQKQSITFSISED